MKPERQNSLPDAPGRGLETAPATAAPLPEWAPSLAVANAQQHYHWTGLPVQSFEFNALEAMFRISTENVLRTLTVDRAYE